jgi:hypothetical protein
MQRDTQQRPRSYLNMRGYRRRHNCQYHKKAGSNLTNQEQWMGLCELASNEHDQEQLGALFEEILRLLEASRAPSFTVWPRLYSVCTDSSPK